MIPAVQSPTTPSGKRLSQNPLTFAVTPPPGRSRTPTSHKTFISSLATDSPPKSLSPVVEQQPKIGPPIIRTPVEDIEPMTEDKQAVVTDMKSVHLDSIPNTTNNSNSEILNSPSRSSSLIEDKSNITENTDQTNNNRAAANDSLSSEPTSAPLLSSPNVEDTQQSNGKDENEDQPISAASQEEALQASTEDTSVNNNKDNEEQHDDVKKSPSSSRQNSAINESQQQQDQIISSPMANLPTLPHIDATNVHSEQLDRRASSSDIHQPEVQSEDSLTDQPPRRLSTTNVNTLDEEQPEQISIPLSNTNNDRSQSPPPAETLEEHISSPSDTENHHILKASSFEHPPHSPTKDQQNDSLLEDNDLQASQSTILTESSTFQSGDTKADSYENITV